MENVEKLAQQLQEASDAYYNSGTPVISDAEFDSLVEQLRKLAPDHPFLKAVGAVTVGAWPKFKHKYAMGSQDKVKTKEEFLKWAEGKGKLVITDKLDGSTIALYYKSGQLMDAVTRGDGLEGENITPNVLKMRNVKDGISGFSGALRGEMVISSENFEKYFKPLGYKNPRNAANGVARDKSNSELIKYIQVVYFDVIASDMTSETAKEAFIADQNLYYVFSAGPFNAEKAWEVFEKRAIERPTLAHEIDGMVVKVNNLEEQQALGDLNNRPRGQIAIKFTAQAKETVVQDIQWQVGRNGRISPVAIVVPVDIGGVTITRVTLNNRDYIKTLGVSVGATVVVTRNNDVIPGITSVTHPGVGETNEPEKCPTCGEVLEVEGAYLLCVQTDCQGKTVGGLVTWFRATKILGVGPAVLRELIDMGIDDPVKLYEATQEDFAKACKSDKNGQKLHQQIVASREMTLSTLLYGLNLPHLGEINCRRVEKHFGSLSKLLESHLSDFEAMPGVKTTAKTIFEAVVQKAPLIQKLTKFVEIKTLNAQGPLAGKSFCITGELSEPRDAVQEWIRSLGGEIKTGVSKNLDFLVTNDANSGSSKNKKAAAMGVKVVDEAALRAMGAAK